MKHQALCLTNTVGMLEVKQGSAFIRTIGRGRNTLNSCVIHSHVLI